MMTMLLTQVLGTAQSVETKPETEGAVHGASFAESFQSEQSNSGESLTMSSVAGDERPGAEAKQAVQDMENKAGLVLSARTIATSMPVRTGSIGVAVPAKAMEGQSERSISHSGNRTVGEDVAHVGSAPSGQELDASDVEMGVESGSDSNLLEHTEQVVSGTSLPGERSPCVSEVADSPVVLSVGGERPVVSGVATMIGLRENSHVGVAKDTEKSGSVKTPSAKSTGAAEIVDSHVPGTPFSPNSTAATVSLLQPSADGYGGAAAPVLSSSEPQLRPSGAEQVSASSPGVAGRLSSRAKTVAWDSKVPEQTKTTDLGASESKDAVNSAASGEAAIRSSAIDSEGATKTQEHGLTIANAGSGLHIATMAGAEGGLTQTVNHAGAQGHAEAAGSVSGEAGKAASLAPSFNATPEHMVLSASTTVLEVGVMSGTHGWLKIRAEMGGEGVVNAAVSAGSATGQDMLHRELPGLTGYLQQTQAGVNATVVDRTHGAMQTTAGFTGSGEQTSQRQPQGAGAAGVDREISPGSREEATFDGSGLPVASGSLPVLLEGSGSWLNVRV